MSLKVRKRGGEGEARETTTAWCTARLGSHREKNRHFVASIVIIISSLYYVPIKHGGRAVPSYIHVVARRHDDRKLYHAIFFFAFRQSFLRACAVRERLYNIVGAYTETYYRYYYLLSPENTAMIIIITLLSCN